MTRFENVHVIANSEDTVSVHATEATNQASVSISNYDKTYCFTVGLEHIPQIEQLLNALWSMKDEQNKQVREKLEAVIEQEWSETKDLAHLASDEF